MSSNTGVRYAPELRERTVRMYREMRPDYQSDTAAMVKVAALRAAGLTLRQIAAQVGISHPSVLRLLAAANIVT